MVLKPFFAFYDLDIFEEYRPVSFCRMSLNLSLSDISPHGWIQIMCFGQENTDIIFSGDHGRVLICLISGDTDSDYLVRASLPL